jgi:hypothetical protein
MNSIFANCSKEDTMYPFKIKEIVETQRADLCLNILAQDGKYTTQLVENIQVLWKGLAMVLPTSLQHRAKSWYHHYLQHTAAICLEEQSIPLLDTSVADIDIDTILTM